MATSVNEFAVFQMMSPMLGHNCVPRSSVIPAMPTRPMAAATGTPSPMVTVISAARIRSDNSQLN